MTASKRIMVVVGATGNQGSSVARTFLNLADWHVRCLTRSPTSSASTKLASLGAEIVQADLSDLSSLQQAFSNATAIFVNTDFWAPYVAAKKAAANQEEEGEVAGKAAFETENLHGRNAAHAAAGVSTLERFVYSALPSVEKPSNGKYSSYHLDSKGAVVDYILVNEPELAKKTSFIYLGAYNTNAFVSPKLDPVSGRYKLLLPFTGEDKMPIIDPSTSTGLFVRALVEDEEPGKSLLAYDSYLTMGAVVSAWSKASGKEADYQEVTSDFLHQNFGIPRENLVAFDAMKEFGYMGALTYIEPSDLKKPVQTKSFEDWLGERDWKAVLDEPSAAFALSSMK